MNLFQCAFLAMCMLSCVHSSRIPETKEAFKCCQVDDAMWDRQTFAFCDPDHYHLFTLADVGVQSGELKCKQTNKRSTFVKSVIGANKLFSGKCSTGRTYKTGSAKRGDCDIVSFHINTTTLDASSCTDDVDWCKNLDGAIEPFVKTQHDKFLSEMDLKMEFDNPVYNYKNKKGYTPAYQYTGLYHQMVRTKNEYDSRLALSNRMREWNGGAGPSDEKYDSQEKRMKMGSDRLSEYEKRHNDYLRRLADEKDFAPNPPASEE